MSITRRSFVKGAAVASAATMLAACGTSTDGTATSSQSVPDSSSYPIDPDGSDVEAKWTSEVVGEERRGDGWTRVTNPDGGATLGVMDTSKIIQVNGLAFKDLNGNGKLDLFEDWRQSAEDRATAFANELDKDTILPLMMHYSTFNIDTHIDQVPEGSGFMASSESTTDYLDKGVRTVLDFAAGSPVDEARWTNKIQAYCESQPYSIPVNVSNNERTFDMFPPNLGLAASFDPDMVKEVAAMMSKMYRAAGVTTLLGPQIDLCSEPRWSRIPGAMGDDPALARDIARALVDGYQSTFDGDGNDQGWGTDSLVGMMKHYPGDGPGEGGREAHSANGKYNVYPGQNFAASLVSFIDGGLKLDGKTEKCEAVMPSYSIAYSDDGAYGDLKGSAYSSYKINILRDQCNYDGLLCTDWGVTNDQDNGQATPWGVEDTPESERFELLLENSIDQIGGTYSFDGLTAGYEAMTQKMGDDEALQRIRESARRILRSFYKVGLFENPYLVSSSANDLEGTDEAIDLGHKAVNASIVMLKNKGGVIKDASANKPTVYIPMKVSEGSTNMFTGETTEATASMPMSQEEAEKYFTVVTDTADGSTITRTSADQIASCDYVIACVESPSSSGYDDTTGTYLPKSLQYGEYVANGSNVRQTSIAGDKLADGTQENRSYYGQTAVVSNTDELDYIKEVVQLAAGKPVVVCVSAANPMIFSEFEGDVDSILIGFAGGMSGTSVGGGYDSFLQVVSGTAEPSALLPMQMPANMDTVEAQDEDVPRDMECYTDSEGNTYDFGFGMNWSGVISDDRVNTYAKANPLTQPESVSIEL